MQKKDFYNQIASKYDDWIADPKTKVTYLDWTRKVFDTNNISGGEILDIGCGPGNLKEVLGDAFKYTGIDISENMLKLAEARGYDVIHGSMEEIVPTLPDKSYDYIVCLGAMFFVEDVQTMLLQFERIARKGYVISLEEVTNEYIKTLTLEDKVYDHSSLAIKAAKHEDFLEAWVSPTTGYHMRAKLIFKGVA